MSLEESIDYYFAHCRTTATLGERCEADAVVTLYHEDLLAQPDAVLLGLCGALGLDLYPGYLEDRCRILFSEPTHT